MIVYPTIPEEIVIHLGAPSSNAQNVTESFASYIKNVASSEVYPTWPEEALKANILAQISVALNRVYTEYYRSAGYNFDITSSPAYDQTYVPGREIFTNISELVDELFDSYIRREGRIEPLFAAFCDGIEVNCDGLTQWGSVDLANAGQDYVSILKSFYGPDIEIVTNVPIENIPESVPPVSLKEGDTGRDVEEIQRKLNRISANFPGIPKIYPQDGFFDTSTTDAVRKFQEVFGLSTDGIVGKETWYEINFIYNAVKKLASLSSEGLTVSEISTDFPSSIGLGDSGAQTLAIQYFLNFIGLFVPSVSSPAIDGSFGAATEEAVKSFQRTYGIEPSGVVDRLTFDNIENVYQGILKTLPYEFSPGVILPFPGRVLRLGMSGDDVLALQEYLNYISNTYTDIPKIAPDGVYGPGTERAIEAFKNRFGITANPGRVGPALWSNITSIYDDLYNGNQAAEGQFPGYIID